jgi:YegS/Rv2252/BmrU family lipid kinase
MADRPKSQPALLRALLRKQNKHEALLTRVEKSAARLERHKDRFKALELGIADLEQRLARPRKEQLGQQAASDGALKRARLIFNPTSGRNRENNAERLAEIVSSLRAHGIEARVGLKTSGHAARKLARKAVRAGNPLLIVAAGDGTIAEVASQLVGSSTALAIVPIGTMNNIARSLGVPLGIDDACALIGMGTMRHVDVGRVTTTEDPDGSYFIESTGVGLSAIGTFAGQAIEKRHWRLIPRALRKFFESKPGSMRVELDGTVIEASTRMVTVSNAPLMGKNLLAAPGAKMDDALLDVYIYDSMGDVALVEHFTAAASGTPGPLKGYHARHVRITTEEPAPAEADGIAAPRTHVIEIEIVPRALSMIVGNGIALSVPVESAPSAPTFAANPPHAPAPTPPHTNGTAGAPVADPELART